MAFSQKSIKGVLERQSPQYCNSQSSKNLGSDHQTITVKLQQQCTRVTPFGILDYTGHRFISLGSNIVCERLLLKMWTSPIKLSPVKLHHAPGASSGSVIHAPSFNLFCRMVQPRQGPEAKLSLRL
jgi:hypothetical protein